MQISDVLAQSHLQSQGMPAQQLTEECFTAQILAVMKKDELGPKLPLPGVRNGLVHAQQSRLAGRLPCPERAKRCVHCFSLTEWRMAVQ